MNQSNPLSTTSSEALLTQVNTDPTNWVVRKEAAVKLYEEQKYLEAADVLWNAPEMPATDMDVAFAIKVVSRARPNRAIRLIYEVIRRNVAKPEKNLAMARGMNMIGMPMEAARFYGAALATGAEHFDLSFEKQMLWFDDSGSLLEAWEKSDQDAKPPLAVPLVNFSEETFDFSKLTEDVQPPVDAGQAPAPAAPKGPMMPGGTLAPPAPAPMPSATALVRASQGSLVSNVVAPPVTAPPQSPGFLTPPAATQGAPVLPTPPAPVAVSSVPAPAAMPAPVAMQAPPAPVLKQAAPTIPLGQPTQILQAMQSAPAPLLTKRPQLPQMPPLGGGSKGLLRPPVANPLISDEENNAHS